MGKFAKWIGGGLGFVFGGPIGGLLGFFLGSVVDGTSVRWEQTGGDRRVYRTTPGDFGMSLLVLIAAWAIATGIMQVWGAIKLRKEIEGEWLLGLSGSLSILLGVVLLLQPAAGAVAVVWWIGAFAILMGIAYVGLALRLRKHAHRED